MPIPNGYRLLTSSDVGKVFGVDLELEVYIDSDEYPISTFPTGTSAEITNFAEVKWEYEAGFDQNMHVIYIENNAVFRAGWVFTNAYGSNIYTMSNNTKVETYNTDTDWNTWFYVKDIANPYTITSSKPKITINCKDKLMTKDLTITRELWDGSYEEIVSGFTLTLNCASAVINYEYNLYSLDDGATWNQFTSETMILQNVTQIKFSETANGLTYLKVGTTEGGQDIASMLGYESDNIILTADTTWYVWSVVDYGGAN